MYSPPFRIIVYNIHDGFSAYKVSYSYDVLSYKIAELYAIIGTGKNKRQKQKRSLSESWTNFIIPGQFFDNRIPEQIQNLSNSKTCEEISATDLTGYLIIRDHLYICARITDTLPPAGSQARALNAQGPL